MRLISVFALSLIAACDPAVTTAPPAASGPVELVQTWQAHGLTDPEGIAHAGGVLLVSNVAGEASEKDGQGWISRLGMDGRMLEAEWVTGLNAPKGMAVRDGILFVADIDAYHTIDVETGLILNTFQVQDAVFLNDVALWQGGVYAADSGTASIYQLDENGSKRWLHDDRLAGVNGLLSDGDDLLATTMDEGLLVRITGAGEITELASGMRNADGLARLDDGRFLVSSWPGKVWQVDTDGTARALLDTEADGILQNDLTRIDDLIIIPNWKPGTVTAWRVGSTG